MRASPASNRRSKDERIARISFSDLDEYLGSEVLALVVSHGSFPVERQRRVRNEHDSRLTSGSQGGNLGKIACYLGMLL